MLLFSNELFMFMSFKYILPQDINSPSHPHPPFLAVLPSGSQDVVDQSVGLCFIILPCLFLLIIYFAMRFKECGDDCVDCEDCTCICGCSPFFPAFSVKNV